MQLSSSFLLDISLVDVFDVLWTGSFVVSSFVEVFPVGSLSLLALLDWCSSTSTILGDEYSLEFSVGVLASCAAS